VKKNFYESLNDLVTDSRFRSLALTQNFESFLSTNGINEAENMQMFSWFLQPKGSHGLKDVFVKEFFTTAWTMIHGQYGETFKTYKNSHFYTALSPVMFEQMSFSNAFVDRDYVKTVAGADMVITDVASKIMVIVNNHFDKTVCDKAMTHFNTDTYKHFDYKIFVSFDMQAQGNWMFMNNEWIINLCTNLIDCPQYSNQKTTGMIKDFYQFLTGTQYGVSHDEFAGATASLIADYCDTFKDLKSFKAEKIANVALVDINPREYATTYAGKISEKEFGVLSLFWAYRNTWTTFFELSDLETVTRDLEKSVEGKAYNFDRSFIRNGLRFTPAFGKVKTDRSFMNTIFDVEMVKDMNKNLCLSLVINKGAWDRLTLTQRETIQKDFGFNGSLLNDRLVVNSSYYKQGWMNKDLCQDITGLFAKVDSYLAFIGIRAA
jgi:hypothetical protein